MAPAAQLAIHYLPANDSYGFIWTAVIPSFKTIKLLYGDKSIRHVTVGNADFYGLPNIKKTNFPIIPSLYAIDIV